MKNQLLILCLLASLLISPLLTHSIQAIDEPLAIEGVGKITYQPNVIPNLTISFVEEFFRFQWLENRFDLKLLIVYNDRGKIKELSLRDFWGKTDRVMEWEQLVAKATGSMYEFGYNITNIPEEITSNVEYLIWKIEGASFDVSEIELEVITHIPDSYNITRIILPDNLVLSYEDLLLYNFTVFHPNKYETIVKGVKGKNSWNLDPITFSVGIITVIGGTEGTPLNFKDIWNADQTGGWNVVHNNNNGDLQFEVNARLCFGNGTVAGTTWFADTNVQVVFPSGFLAAGNMKIIDLKSYVTFRLGEVTDVSEKVTRYGVEIRSDDGDYYHDIYAGAGSTIYLYGTTISGFDSAESSLYNRLNIEIRNIGRMWNCKIGGLYLIKPLSSVAANLDLWNVVFTDTSYPLAQPVATMDRITFLGAYSFMYCAGAVSGTFKNIYGRNADLTSFYMVATSVNFYVINGDLDAWTFARMFAATAKLYRQYEFDLIVNYPNNTVIEDANVTITYYGYGGGTVGTWLTNSTGQIPTQTLTMGFYNGTGGNTIYGYNPYNLLITENGDETYNSNFTLAQKTDWIIAIQAGAEEEASSFWCVAAFNWTAGNPEANDLVTFYGSPSNSSHAITSWSWNFGDGNTTTGAYETITHTYSTNNNYTVTLAIVNSAGNASNLQEYIIVGEVARWVWEFGVYPLNGTILMLIIALISTAMFIIRKTVGWGAISFVSWLIEAMLWLLIDPISYMTALFWLGISFIMLLLTIVTQLHRAKVERYGEDFV